MSEIDLPPFYVGQKVVRIVESNRPDMKKGSKYTIADIRYCCRKWGWRIALVEVDNTRKGVCECGRRDTPNFAAKNFAPVEENFETISFKEVIRKETPLTCSN